MGHRAWGKTFNMLDLSYLNDFNGFSEFNDFMLTASRLDSRKHSMSVWTLP
jgi:hypothetical protein